MSTEPKPADLRLPSFCIRAPEPVAELDAGNAHLCVYATEEQMGLASALSLAAQQCRLVAEKGETSLMIMAAPSAFAFYRAYVGLAQASHHLQHAIRNTHFFQFDDYALPIHHPASFRFLLCKHLFTPLATWTDAAKVHLFEADAPDVEAACVRYRDLLLACGPDLQLKGVGENGHWGFHEPGIPLDGSPDFIRVALSEENVVQQMRDHPQIFPTADSVPRHAYTANVALFMKARVLVEDNIPQASKAFALLAGYGSDTVDASVPTSAVKTHPCAVIRTTSAAAWALLDYRQRGIVTRSALDRMAALLAGDQADRRPAFLATIRAVLATMHLAIE